MASASVARDGTADAATPRIDGAHRPGQGLARPYYTDPAIFERDMQRIFLRHWLCAGHVSAIPNPGDYCTVRVENESVILSRAADGRLYALLNVCRHRGAEVCAQTSGHTEFFVCPYHAWTYGLDGSLQAARHMPADFDRAAHGLRPVHLRVAEGLIFISLAETPLGFDHVAEVLHHSCGRYGWAEAKIAHRETYAIAANWKLAVENYVECYHCAPSHPEYSKLHALEQPPVRIERLNARMEARTRALGVEVCSSEQWQGSEAGGEAVHAFRYALYDGVATGSPDGEPVAPLMGAFTGYDGGVTSIHLGPASFLVAYADHGVIYRFVPRGVETSEMELIWLVRGDAREGIDYDRERLTWLWRVTSEADKRIIEHTARGVRSRFYAPGPLAPMEHNERRYIEWYLREIA
ncbi:MAG TPA: aromatic ring-hydroxylating dioxygenase subunit alpha [Acetobacteraceae bacterium]|nr:aromatic ring-hydroxylating dioxygenase subunit alpha [Acetobacteraceae bacterium]